MPTKVSKQLVKRTVKCWKSYFAAIREDGKSSEKFLCDPKISGYKNKTHGRYVVIDPSKESIYKTELVSGIVHLSMSEIRIATCDRSNKCD